MCFYTYGASQCFKKMCVFIGVGCLILQNHSFLTSIISMFIEIYFVKTFCSEDVQPIMHLLLSRGYSLQGTVICMREQLSSRPDQPTWPAGETLEKKRVQGKVFVHECLHFCTSRRDTPMITCTFLFV